MEDFTIESRYLKLCYVLRAFSRCMKDAFYRPDFQKFLMCPLIKRLSQSRGRTSGTLNRALEILG